MWYNTRTYVAHENVRLHRREDNNIFMASSYSGTSTKGPSEKGTTSLQRTLFWTPFPLAVVYLRVKDNLSIEDKMADPKVSFIRRFHCSS